MGAKTRTNFALQGSFFYDIIKPKRANFSLCDNNSFISGAGEATDLIRIATKADGFVDAVDDINDTAKAIDRIEDGIDGATALHMKGI